MGFMYEFPHARTFDSDLREIIELFCTVKELPKTWETYKQIMDDNFTELKVFVTEYFDNLDVQDEINNKIDNLIESGFIEEIIANWLNAHIHGYITPQMFGAVGDGLSDDTIAFKKALNYLESNKDYAALHLPAGDYLLSEQLITRDVSIIGDGVQVSRLIFDSNSTSAGLKIYQATVNIRSACVSIRDLSILYDGVENFSGIEIEGEYLNERWQISPLITRIFIGTNKDTTVNHGWYIGIAINNCDAVRITECSINGRIQDAEPNYSAMYGVYINSSNKPHATSHMVENCMITHFKNAIYVPVTEGLKIINNDIVGVDIGLNCEGTDYYPYILIEGNHINASSICINISKYKEIIISNNDCYIQQSTNDVNFGIVINEDVVRFNISNNIIANLSDKSVYGMDIEGSHGIIIGNLFHNQGIGAINPAINLDSTSTYCMVSYNNAHTLKIDNFGSENSVSNNI